MAQGNLGRYEIKGEIGRGGMATVYHAYDPRFERDVAIKVLPHAFLHDPQFRTRFEREAKTIALLEHPAIVPVYDFGEEEEQPYIVMRYMSGGSLSDRIHQGSISAQEASQIISRLAPALDAAHARGIIHRDLKPGNILFDQYGNAFLSDFGIARLANAQSSATLTQGAILGTPAYMSPEQVKGESDLDGRSDIYSLGVILYEMLAGTTPYRADTPGKVMMMHILDEVPHLRTVKKDITPEVDAVIEKAMAKEPDQRFSTTAEMATAVEAALRGSASETRIQAAQTKIYSGDQTRISPPGTKETQTENEGISATVLTPQKTNLETAPKTGLKMGGILIAAVIVLLFGGGLIAGGIFVLGRPHPTATPTQAAALVTSPENTPIPTIAPPTETPQPEPSATSLPLPSSTWTTVPVVVIEPTATIPGTPTKAPQVSLGGADKIAFLNKNDVWVANIDGSDPVQLTNDRADKTDLRWTPDGKAVAYISGKCIKMVWIDDGKVDLINCFVTAQFLEAFEFSKDGKLLALTLDRELYILNYDLAGLQQIQSRSELRKFAVCPDITPYNDVAYKYVRWSSDNTKLAVVFLAAEGGRQIDQIRIMDIGKCNPNPNRLDEFPARRFTISDYANSPFIKNFSWNGDVLFTFNSFQRNGGFGNLYVYNSGLHKLQNMVPGQDDINPVENTCCYRDPIWSPDGRYLLFVFQDIRQGANAKSEIYYVPFGDVGTRAQFSPLPLGDEFFTDRMEKPQPALRPVN